MKRFLIQLLKFSVAMLILFIIHISFIYSLNIKIKKDYNFKIETDPKYAVFGHSHPACAFDEGFIKSFYNASSSGERYFYTFLKLRKFLEDNRSVKTVFIEFDDVQISEESDSEIWSDENLDNNLGIFSPLMKFDENLLLFKKNPIRYLRDFLSLPREQFSRIINKQFAFDQFIYKPQIKKDTTRTLGKLGNNVGKVEIKDKFIQSKYCIQYLDQCIKLCNEKNVNVILVRSPVHERRIKANTELKYLEILRNHFSRVKYFDFKDFPLKEEDLLDYGHLSKKGALKFSLWFDNLISLGLLEKHDPQIFIDKHVYIAREQNLNSK